MTTPNSESVRLVSMEGDVFIVDVKIASLSQLLKTMIDAAGTEEEIPIPNVKSSILSKVIEYCTMHHDNPAPEIEKPLKTSNLAEVISEQDFKFIDIEQEMLFELILAANFLDIKPLLDLACARVASMIKGKRVEELRSMFKIVNDFTPEQEAQVREENKWCEDL